MRHMSRKAGEGVQQLSVCSCITGSCTDPCRVRWPSSLRFQLVTGLCSPCSLGFQGSCSAALIRGSLSFWLLLVLLGAQSQPRLAGSWSNIALPLFSASWHLRGPVAPGHSYWLRGTWTYGGILQLGIPSWDHSLRE